VIRRAGDFERDLYDQAAHIARDSIDAAERLVDSVEDTLRALERMPRLGRRWSSPRAGLHEVRYFGVRKLPNHLLFYRAIEGGVEALRLLHAARDLGRAMEEPGAGSE
jgi:toxin ParE1/3/4